MPESMNYTHILQLSDLHLPRQEVTALDWCQHRGQINAINNLRTVIDRVQRHHPQVDAVIVTGDIAQEPCQDTYRRFLELLRPLGIPVACTPGNHDDRAVFYAAIEASDFCSAGPLVLDEWAILAVDSVVDGANHGKISCAALSRLQAELDDHKHLPTMVITHHHPIPCGSPWMDDIGLAEAQQLLDTLANHPQVKALCYGHIHQEKQDRIGSIDFFAGPSTCLQFEPESWQQSFSDYRPAYRLYRLNSSGVIDSSVHRIEAPSCNQSWDNRKLA